MIRGEAEKRGSPGGRGFIIGPQWVGWAILILAHPRVKTVMRAWEGQKQEKWSENAGLIASADFAQIAVVSHRDSTGDSHAARYHLRTERFEPSLKRPEIGRGSQPLAELPEPLCRAI